MTSGHPATSPGCRGREKPASEVIDLFVPGGRSVELANDRPVERGALYKFPIFGLLALGIAAVALGIGRGAIADILELAGGKTPTGSRRKLAERPLVQMQVAQSEAMLAGARAFVFESVAEAFETQQPPATRPDPRPWNSISPVSHADNHPAPGHRYDLSRSAASRSIYLSSSLQRRFRDVHAATQHVMVAQPTYELAGRVMLGLDTDTSVL